MRATTSDGIDVKALENGQASAFEVKNLINDFKRKALEEVQSLVEEIKSFARNSTDKTSIIANNFGNDPNAFAPFMHAEPNSNIQKIHQVPKCFKFLQADRKQGR